MNDVLRQLIGMGPGIGAAVAGNGNAFASFMDGWQRAQQQDEQRKRLQQQDAMLLEDRQFARDERTQRMTRQQAADAQAAEDRRRQQALEMLSLPGQLAEVGGQAEDPMDAQRIIESAMPRLMEVFGQDAMAMGQPAVEMAQRTITSRQRKQAQDYIEQALKTSFVADNPEADPELQLPSHLARVIGKPSARLSELQQFAQLPVGKPAKPKGTPFTLSPGLTRFDSDGNPIASVPTKPEKPATVGYRWLVQGDGEPFEWPEDQPAPRGAKPYDVVAARKTPTEGPSAYSVERSNRTIASVDELMGKVNRWTTGLGSMLAGVPETDARNFKAELDTLKANIAFNELTAMREASKTGGALGQVSNVELGLLTSALGALDAGQSPENIKAQLQKIKDSVRRWQAAQGVTSAVSHTPGAKKNPFRP